MIKSVINVICVLAILSLCVTMIGKDKESQNDFYYNMSLNQNLNDEIKVTNVIEWFKNQGDQITFDSSKNVYNKTVICIYTIKTKEKKTGSLEVIYKQDSLELDNIILRMTVNGSPKTLTGKDATRIMLTLLNSNNDFDYHFF